MSDANRVQLSYIPEVTFATTPVGNLQIARFVSESLGMETTTTQSNEINSDRQISDVIRTDIRAAGDVNVEFSYGAHDDWTAATFESAGWSTPVIIGPAVTFSAAAADQSINDSANGLGTLIAGQWVRVSGFANAANNGVFKIITKVAGKITLQGGTLVNEAAGPNVKIAMGAQIVNGVTQTSYSIERKYGDLTNTFAILPGILWEQMSQSIRADAIVTGAFAAMGKNEASAAATIGTGYVAAPTNNVMAAVSDVYSVVEGGAVMDITDMSWTLKNNLRGRKIVGTLGPKSMGSGSVNLTGSLTAYFATAGMMDEYLNFTTTSLAVTYRDGANNAYAIEFPAIKYTAGKRVAGGINTDVMAAMTFMAKKDPTSGITARIARFPAP